MRKVLIVGATSAMAEAVARKFAQQNDRLFLVGRNKDKLSVIASDLLVRGADKVAIFEMDANDIAKHNDMLKQAQIDLEGLDTVLIAHGTFSDQKSCEQNVQTMLQELNTNGISTIALLTKIANIFEQQKMGTIGVISSVAGDRGRSSNYVYGSAKAAVSTFLEGLRVRMFKADVHVIDIRPGFVATPMTKDLNLPKSLTVTADVVALDIVRAFEKKKNVLYTPFFWRYIMLIIKSIPPAIFNRLSL
ncbi:SDR family oxidoreductase [Vibrio scophthalmi]|uniref:SDR family oxidoreductase n=1 Tax=Vibrio scophthalmi TaxID=45658 RepID=UPI003EBBA8AE